MDAVINGILFAAVDPPNVRIQRPKWMELPSPMTVFIFVLGTYFLVTGGVIYDVINEPPSVGSTTDERGFQRPQAILPGRINGQYIMEGLAAAFMFTLGGVGFILLDKVNEPQLQRKTRLALVGTAFGCVEMTRIITSEEVSQHNSKSSAWVIIKGKVYDVSKFLDEHPGGPEVLLEQAGKDATVPFLDVGHSSDAQQMLNDYLIGELQGGSKVNPSVPAKPSQKSEKDSSLKDVLLSPTWTNFLIPTFVGFLVYALYKSAVRAFS
ncbi:unnamed protein product, partial [Mesorhabditis belari]|uniref:Oligosaccharyltransferase complex subunit n=1 Tax=Mesorhabditis belari TaxID=2138241 RepID=A0AAF3ESZ4_9BILA